MYLPGESDTYSVIYSIKYMFKMEWDLLVALVVIVISSISLIYILFSLDRDHEREMDRISSEMKELDEKMDRALGRN